MTTRGKIQSIDTLLARGEEVLLAALHGALALLVVSAVAFRYALSDPLTWSEELIIILFVWMVFLGAASAFHTRSHIIIDILVLTMPRRLRRVVGAAAVLGTLGFLLALVWFGYRYALREFGNVTPMLGVSAAWLVAPLVVGSVLSIVHVLCRLFCGPPDEVLWADLLERE